MTKDNIIETVPLSAIRKVIELDAQDARELRAVAVELHNALQGLIDIDKRDMSNPKYDGYFETARAAVKRAREIL